MPATVRDHGGLADARVLARISDREHTTRLSISTDRCFRPAAAPKERRSDTTKKEWRPQLLSPWTAWSLRRRKSSTSTTAPATCTTRTAQSRSCSSASTPSASTAPSDLGSPAGQRLFDQGQLLRIALNGTAKWTFSISQAGWYRVSATWPAAAGQAEDMAYSVLTEEVPREVELRGTIRVDQTAEPGAFAAGGTPWENQASTSAAGRQSFPRPDWRHTCELISR